MMPNGLVPMVAVSVAVGRMFQWLRAKYQGLREWHTWVLSGVLEFFVAHRV